MTLRQLFVGVVRALGAVGAAGAAFGSVSMADGMLTRPFSVPPLGGALTSVKSTGRARS